MISPTDIKACAKDAASEMKLFKFYAELGKCNEQYKQELADAKVERLKVSIQSRGKQEIKLQAGLSRFREAMEKIKKLSVDMIRSDCEHHTSGLYIHDIANKALNPTKGAGDA